LLGSAAVPSLRTVLATPGVAVAALAALPAVVSAARGGHDLRTAVVAAALVSGAACGFAVDDPAAVTLAASPTPLRARLALRVLALAVASGGAWLVVAACARLAGAPLAPLGPRAAEAAAAAGLAIVAARGGSRRASPDGLSGAAAALAVPLAMTLVGRHQTWIPAVGRSDQALRWWAVAALAWIAVWCGTRDP
jgi:hypothetical protein